LNPSKSLAVGGRALLLSLPLLPAYLGPYAFLSTFRPPHAREEEEKGRGLFNQGLAEGVKGGTKATAMKHLPAGLEKLAMTSARLPAVPILFSLYRLRGNEEKR